MHQRLKFREGHITYKLSPESTAAKAEFLDKWGKSEPSEDQQCYVCGGEEFDLVAEIDRYGFYYPTGICKKCGCVQQIKYYSDECLTDFYTRWYRTVYGNKGPATLFASQYENQAPLIYKFMSEFNIGQTGLEIGCGAAGILGYFKDQGKTVTGLDYNEDYLDYGRGKGVNLLRGSLEALEPDQKFDFIIISHVLEHIVKPVEFLKQVNERLTDDGMIYVEVPSLHHVAEGGYEYDLLGYLQNAHVIHFHQPSLNLIARQAGLKVVKSDDFICSVLKKDPAGAQQPTEAEMAEALKLSRDLMDGIERSRTSMSHRLHLGYRSTVSTLDKMGLKKPLKKLMGR